MAKNLDRIPKNLDITLSDFSKGMLTDAKATLGKESEQIQFSNNKCRRNTL